MDNTQLKKLRIIWTQKEFLLEFNMLNTLENLFNLARERKKKPVDGSYTNKIHEAADVFYHLLMYLEANDVKIEEVMEELEKRKK